MAGSVALALLVLGLNVAWSLLPHRKPHPADMTLRATPVGPLLPVSRKHPAVAETTPQPTPPPEPRPSPKPPKMTLRATAVSPPVRTRPRHSAPTAAAAQATPQPTPQPEPRRKYAPPTVAAVAQPTPRPTAAPEPRRKKPADMTLRATAVGPLLHIKPRHRAIASAHVKTDVEITDAEIAAQPPPEEPPAPAAEEIRRIGVVRVIGAGGTFLLIEARDSDVSADLPKGTELRCRGSAATGGEQTALLRVSPERRAPFVVADIVSGSPQVGDGVYLPDAASPPR